MLSVEDIRGVYVLPPTPCKEGGGGWDCTDSVDLEETAAMTGFLLQPGVAGLGLFGTTGEGHSLLYEEKLAAARTVVETVAGRAQVFAGATALGTREVIRQMRGLKEVGVDGALVGLPLWQTPTVENAVGFFADLSEAVPDLPVMVYSNSWFFKMKFPPAFWLGVRMRAPTVVASKQTHGFEHYLEELDAVDGRINLMPGEFGVFAAWRLAPDRITALWSTQAALGPEPSVALMAAIEKGDPATVEAVIADFQAVPPYAPPGAMKDFDYTDDFARYNTQVAKWRLNVSGVIKAGPLRPPYTDLPEEWKRQVEKEVEGFAALRAKYTDPLGRTSDGGARHGNQAR
ncbi:MAG TPA: dihydrodipicolinate synthase family protein [Acidimicrobiales bacterium]|nr:dihydrodipicolinate synthase family protein [Acidimicrobiales bacterium]